MNRMKKSAVLLVAALAAAAMLMGCSKKGETESVADQLTELTTEKPTEKVEEKPGTAITTTKTYTSKDKTMSIKLPDESWKNTKDADDTLEFESDGKGTITVNHITGTDISKVKLPSTKEEVLDNLETAGKDIKKYEVINFTKQTVGTSDKYHTIVKCTDSTEKYAYTVGYDIVSDTDIYSVTGVVEEEDEELMRQIQVSVESFQVLKKSSGTKKNGSTTGQSESTDSTDSSSSSAGKTTVIYDSNGNPIYVTQDASGVWKDSNGKTYEMQQYGALGSDGYWYTYDSSSSDNNNSNTDNDNKETNSSGETSGFYDQSGNYISVTKDSNGNWVDSYGTVYYFGENGVTDNAGNYFPYKGTDESNGFYDKDGNYVTVTKDSNGNWVDSAGTVYTFGDTGVTDSSGNFYPY